MAQLGTLSIDFLVNLQNSLNQVSQLENRIAQLENTARDARRAVSDVGNTRVGNAVQAFDDAAGSIDRFRNGLSGVISGQGGLGDLIGAFKGIPPQALLAAGGIIAVTGAVAGLGLAVGSSIGNLREYVAEISSGAKQTGTSFQAFQDLAGAARLAGVDVDSLKDGFLEINATLAEGTESEKAKLFKQLGISILDSAGKMKSADQILEESAGAFAKMESDTERAAMAMRLFGEDAGPKLLPLLSKGKEGLQDLKREYNELAGTVNDKATKQFEDGLKRLNIVIDGAQNALGEVFMPAASLVVNVFLELAKSIKTMLPEGQTFEKLVMDITKGALRLMIQAIDATVKQINNFGRILVITAPFIVQVGTNILLAANAASILLNALDILQGFIRIGVLTVLDAMVQGFENLVGAMASVARTVGLDDLAAGLSSAESSIRGMSSALQGLRSDAMAGIAGDAQDIANRTKTAIGLIQDYGKNVKNIQSVGGSFEQLQSPTAGANKVLEGLTTAVKENTKKVEDNTKATEKTGTTGGKGKDGANVAGAGRQSAVQTFQSIQEQLIKPIDPKLYEADPKYKKLIDEENNKLLQIQRERNEEVDRNANLERQINAETQSINKIRGEMKLNEERLKSIQNEITSSESKRAEALYELQADREEEHKTNLKNEQEVKKQNKNLLDARQSAYNAIDAMAKSIGAPWPINEAMKLVFDGVNKIRDKIEESEVGILPAPRSKAKIAESEARLQEEMQGGRQKASQSAQKALDLSEDLEGSYQKEQEALARRNNLYEQGLAKLKSLSDKRAESQAALISIDAKTLELEERKRKLQEQEAAYLAKIETIKQQDLTLLYIANDIIHEQNALTRAKLELDASNYEFKLAMQRLDEQGLTGTELLIEQQKLRNEYDAEQLDIKARIAAEEDRAAQKSRETLTTAMQRAAELANSNAIAGKEIEILNTKNAFQRIELEYALERLKLNLETLTPVQRELELLKLKLEQEKAITEEKSRQVDLIGQSLSGLGSVVGQFTGLGEKLGLDDSTVKTIEEIGGALGGLGTTASGVARVMAGDLVGGITSIASGIIGTFESIWDLFNDDEEEAEKLDLTPLEPDANRLREQAEEFAKAFVDEQERRLQRPIQITVDARGALVGDDAEIARALGNLLEGEMGRRIGNINVPRGF